MSSECHNYLVYMHQFHNGKKYVGITGKSTAKRWKRGKNYRNNVLMTRAIEKYGWDNIDHTIIESELTKEEAEAKEREMIALYQSNVPEHGYNITSGGECVGKHSFETRQKLSEIKRRLDKDPEYKKRVSESHKGISPPNKGMRMTEGQKMKISLAKRGCIGHGMKKVICVDTGKIYESITVAARETGANAGRIVDVCKHNRKTTNGCRWEYVRE